MNAVRQRFFAIDVLAALNSSHRRNRMNMVGRRHDNRIDILILLIEHPAEVFVLRRLRELFESPGRSAIVNIAESNNILTAARPDIARPPTANADSCNIKLIARCRIARTGENMPRNNSNGCSRGSG